MMALRRPREDADGWWKSVDNQYMFQIQDASRHTRFPDIEGLEAVHHGTIVTIGGTGDDDEHQTDVVSSQTRVSKPVDLGELASRKTEVAFGCGLHFDCLW
jgi:hypothetical protein